MVSRKLRKSRPAPPGPPLDNWFNTYCWTYAHDGRDTAAVEEAKRLVHDRVIESSGAARRSGVTFWVVPRDRALQMLGAPSDPQDEQVIRGLRSRARSVLVIAGVEVDPESVPESGRT